MTSPPDKIIKLACETGALATCAKSKRGVVLFETVTPEHDRHLRADLIIVRGVGANGPPAPITCDGSDACRKHCPSIAVHAERRALDQALTFAPSQLTMMGRALSRCDLVHVKVDERGELVAGGTPSCAECSKHILDLGVRGVWLFEALAEPACPSSKCPFCTGQFCMQCQDGCSHATDERHKGYEAPTGEWKLYPALEFHTLTLAHKRNLMYRGPLAEEFTP